MAHESKDPLCAYFRGHETIADALGIFSASGPWLSGDAGKLTISFASTESAEKLWNQVKGLIGSPNCPQDFFGVFVRLYLFAKQDLLLMETLLSLGFVLHECSTTNQPTMAFNFTTCGPAWRRTAPPTSLPPGPHVKIVSRAVIFNNATSTFHVPLTGLLTGVKAPREPPNFLCEKVCEFTGSKCEYAGTICQVWDAFDDSITNLDLYTFRSNAGMERPLTAEQMASVIEKQCGYAPAEQFASLLQQRKNPFKYQSADGMFVLVPKGV